MHGWENRALRAAACVAVPAMAGAAFCLLTLAVVTWLPALAAAAVALQQWRSDGDTSSFAATLRAFPQAVSTLWRESLALTAVMAVLFANALFLAGRSYGTLLLPVQLVIAAALILYGVTRAAAHALAEPGDGRRSACELAFTRPGRTAVLLTVTLGTPLAMLPVPLGPLLLGPTVPLLLALSLASPRTHPTRAAATAAA